MLQTKPTSTEIQNQTDNVLRYTKDPTVKVKNKEVFKVCSAHETKKHERDFAFSPAFIATSYVVIHIRSLVLADALFSKGTFFSILIILNNFYHSQLQ